MTLLGGRYETLKAIASGGMATVHLGRAIGVGGFERLVAIKVMHPHIAAEEEFVAMFLDEARLAARVRHPNVVATIDVQESGEGLFLVMEFVDGPSLRHVQKAANQRGMRLRADVVLRIMIDTLAGLHAAHELAGDDGAPFNLVHRDVSPANILVGVDGVVRLTDFGVARAETRLSSTRGGKLKGKIPYMPPEQLMGQPIDRRCDIYSAGVVMWESLVGKRLFHAESEGALLQRILSGPPLSIRQVLPKTPPALNEACMRALSHDLNERYQTAADFSDAIEAAASSSGIPIASARAVAKFVAECGAHKKIDLRELAALKSSPSASVPSLRSPLESYPSFPDRTPISSPVAVPSSKPLPSVPSIASTPSGASVPSMTSAPSSVTMTEATMSARPDATRRSSSRPAILIGATVALVGLGGGYYLATRGEAPMAPAAPAAAAPAAPPSATSPPVEVDEPAPVTTTAEAEPDPVVVSSAAPSASSAAAAKAATPAPARVAPRHKAAPKPGPKPFDPERL